MSEARAFRLVVPAQKEDDFVALLWEAGTLGVEVKPAQGGRVVLIAYFPDDGAPLELPVNAPNATVRPVRVRRVDWVTYFRQSFRAFRAGPFEVVPVWEKARSRGGEEPYLLVVDPGRAFGTGAHETTRLCLRAIDEEARRRALGRVLDVGTGTGLLALAAAKRGAVLVAGVDCDPEAVAAAQRHAVLNGVSLRLVQGDAGRPFRLSRFDLVLANLTAPLLLVRHSELAGLLAPEGTLVLSGLLDAHVAAVTAAYHTLGPPVVTTDGEWAALLFRRGNR